jgi:hypothetical protein
VRRSLTLRRNTTRFWLCGILLCLACVAATAQSVGGMLTAQTGASVSSQVSAGVNDAVNETSGSAAGPSGPIEISSHIPVEKQITSVGNNPRSNSVRVLGTATTPTVRSTPRKPPGSTGEGAFSGFGSFPDSTKGTAEVSPPDTGASSSLQWNPSLTFEFRDFQATQFLNPTLNVSGRVLNPTLQVSRQGAHLSERSNLPTGVAPVPPRSGLTTQLQQPALHKSIDQQVGLLGAH